MDRMAMAMNGRTWLRTLLGALALLALLMQPVQPAGAAQTVNGSRSATTTSVKFGDETTITISLTNTGSQAVTAAVTEKLPDEVRYVAGSANLGATTPANGVLTWSNIQISAGQTVNLRYRATPVSAVNTQKTVQLLAFVSYLGANSQGGNFTLPGSLDVVPGQGSGQAPAALSATEKTASQTTLAFGERMTYTITLRNSSGSPLSANVRDPLDWRIEAVNGTISNGGSYDAADNVVTWNNVTVPANGSVVLTFQVEPTVRVMAPSLLINTATITSGGASFTRSVTTVMVMLPIDGEPDLSTSFKVASQVAIAPGETMSYIINVHNSGSADATANVTDPLPQGLEYVDASANQGGVYTSGNRTLTWNNLSVPAGESVVLEFQVTAAGPVDQARIVTNTATISLGGNDLDVSADVQLVPARRGGDVQRPRVRLQINNSDVTNSRDVTLNIQATDNSAVRFMYIREFRLVPGTRPRWEMVNQTNGWVDFQATYPWQLSNDAGVHFVGVWVSDAARNVSMINRDAMDFINLVTANQSVGEGGVVPFLVRYEAGDQVSAQLNVASGDADLYVWYPGNPGTPDQDSTLDGTATDAVSFQAPRDGSYLFLVYGAEASTFTLNLNPTGGPVPALTVNTAPAAKTSFTSEPLLSNAGADPLGVAVAPAAPPSLVYVPDIAR